jgi:hypothetical protein
MDALNSLIPPATSEVGNNLSDWITLEGGMPQGTWLAPNVFLILIDDLNKSWLPSSSLMMTLYPKS